MTLKPPGVLNWTQASAKPGGSCNKITLNFLTLNTLHTSLSLQCTHMKVHLVKGSTLWCSHDFRPRSIVLLGIHMMYPCIIRHATNEELPLDAHDEKSQGWCWRLVTNVFKTTYDDDN